MATAKNKTEIKPHLVYLDEIIAMVRYTYGEHIPDNREGAQGVIAVLDKLNLIKRTLDEEAIRNRKTKNG